MKRFTAVSMFRGFIVVLALALSGSAFARPSYPDRTVHLVLTLPVGMSSDSVMRMIARKLDKMWGQSALIFNKPGATGVIAAEYVLRHPADGYTMLISTNDIVSSAAYHTKLPYDPLKVFVPVTEVTSEPSLICVNPESKIHTLKQLIALAKAKPNSVTFASTGVGTPAHITMEWLAQRAGIKIRHIPFQGGPKALMALMKGEVTFSDFGLGPALRLGHKGKVRCIAMTTAKRSPFMPDMPTVAESGYPGFNVGLWTGIFTRKGTPRYAIRKVRNSIAAVLKMPDIREHLKHFGFTPVGSTTAQFTRFYKSEAAKWRHMTAVTGIHAP